MSRSAASVSPNLTKTSRRRPSSRSKSAGTSWKRWLTGLGYSVLQNNPGWRCDAAQRLDEPAHMRGSVAPKDRSTQAAVMERRIGA